MRRSSPVATDAPELARPPRPPRAFEFFHLRIVERSYDNGIPQARTVRASESHLGSLRDPGNLSAVARDRERDVVVEHAEIMQDGTLWIAASARSPMSRSVLLAYVAATCAHFGPDKEISLEQMPQRR
jgi:hypothetical protein